jgi:hypothetical protein
MKGRFACLIAVTMVFSSCDENKEVVVTETRPTSTRDRSPKLFASSDERFRNAKPSPVKADTPDGWLTVPSTQFRLLNYRFGESGLGEVWVSISAGSVLENVNRWLGQFDGDLLDQAGLDALRDVPIAGGSGKWVEAEGEYASGMGDPARPGYALAGVVASIQGQILTVKMIGPKEEVLAARKTLEEFAKNLTLAD